MSESSSKSVKWLFTCNECVKQWSFNTQGGGNKYPEQENPSDSIPQVSAFKPGKQLPHNLKAAVQEDPGKDFEIGFISVD